MNVAEQVQLGWPQKDGAAIIGYEAVDGASLVGRLMAAFGWSVRLREPAPPEAVPGRASNASMLRLVRDGVGEAPQHDARHGDEATDARHQSITGREP